MPSAITTLSACNAPAVARLLQATLASMRAEGKERAWFMWTGEALAHKMYAPVGFVQTNIWNVYAKPMAAP